MKKGISLIVLIVTIIVMIIIAGAIIISLTETNIIDQAEVAVEKYNMSEVKSAALLAYADWEFGEKTSPVQEYIRQRLLSQKLTDDKFFSEYYVTPMGGIEEVDQERLTLIVDMPANTELSFGLFDTVGVEVDWGDGEVSEISDAVQPLVSHTYVAAGQYEVKFSGIMDGPYSGAANSNFENYLIAVKSWGNQKMPGLHLNGSQQLKYIATPNENSFESLELFGMGSTSIEYIPDYFFMGSKLYDILGAFMETKIRTIPEHIFEGCNFLQEVSDAFSDCENLTGYVPKLWDNPDEFPNITSYDDCFYNSPVTHAYDGSEIPDSWK